MKERSVAIVGAGVAGLAAGVLLARRGVRVRVFEAADKVGGCCGDTRIGGYTFHDGAVYLGGPRLLDAAFERAGLDRPALAPLRPIASSFAANLTDGSVVTVAGGRVGLARGGATRFCDAEVQRFVARWRPLARLFTEEVVPRPPSAWRVLRGGWRHLHKLRGTAAAELRRGFSDGAVRSGLAGALLFAGAAPDRLPSLLVLGLVSMLDEGFFLPEGGMGRIPGVLAEALAASGGALHLGSPVQKIRVERGSVRGLELEGGDRVAADAVLCTASGMATFGGLVAPEHVPASMRRKVLTAPLSHRAVVVQLGLRNRLDVQSHSTSVLPAMAEQHRVASGEEPGRWPNWSVPTLTLPELAPHGGSIVEMFCPVPPGAGASQVEHVADALIEALARHHRLDVAVRRVRGPQQFREELRLHQGALYGLSPAAHLSARFPHRTPIRGLFLAGHTTYPGFGVPMAAISGVLAAEALLVELALAGPAPSRRGRLALTRHGRGRN